MTREKRKPITAKVKKAIEALVSGDVKTVAAAARKAGLSREHLSRELGKPHIAEVLRNRTLRNLSISAARAGAVKTELLDCDSAIVRDRASSFVLGLAGISPENKPLLAQERPRVPGFVIVVNTGNTSKVVADVGKSAIEHEAPRAAEKSGLMIDVTPAVVDR
ncbi:hypothetical protein [Bradyrhizobium cajani]|uniref:Uncharacterized protein n=1 Tax=Bradyrhizobium cajani TaxID=1928661 RepID=A0A844TC75_9BRAD|nr:hypothetical protein [Bradyrhizobium cajani]MCP3370781.1 hypothetical protein [Bradyrhizobium cajani]MVT75886.1 hypothetical protein [Bradyrhizobium cajani]